MSKPEPNMIFDTAEAVREAAPAMPARRRGAGNSA